MSRETHEDANKALEEVTELLKDETLSAEERQTLKIQKASLAAVLLKTWLPMGWGRRWIMLVLLLFGVNGLVEENNYLLLCWLPLPFFSPRLVGEIVHLLGKLSRGVS